MLENTLLRYLPQAELALLRPHFEDVQVAQGRSLLEAGSPIEFVWFPSDCVTSTIVDEPEGSTIEIGLAGREGMAGLSLLMGEPLSNATVIVQIPGNAMRMRADLFKSHVVDANGQLFADLLCYANGFMALIAQTAACNCLHTIDERLTRMLLMTRDRVLHDDMPLTQESLASTLGVRRATVSMAAARLQARGLIKYSRGRLSVLDRTGLEEAGCACYGIIQRLSACA